MRTSLRVALASAVFMIVMTIFAPFAGAATVCGGCFCSANNSPSATGGYACVKVGDYNRWMPWAS